MRRRLRKLAALLILLAAGGFLVAGSGVVSVKASSGHWPVTAWFLRFSMRRSVAFHSLGLQPPRLDDSRLVLRGAGHYETGCRPCHGSPDRPQPAVPDRMTPTPRYLPAVLSGWEPRQLFQIVKHGVKFTGMPAWPAQQRDDEVWAMVAFLRVLPDLDAAAYRRLVDGDPGPSTEPRREEIPEAVAEMCGRCHGVDGRGRGAGAFPRLAGQRPTYLDNALRAFARGERHSGTMNLVASGLSREERRQLASYYGNLRMPVMPRPPRGPASAIERGRAIAWRGIPSQRVPSCADCHGPGAIRRNPAYPVLAGQYADYLVLQLELFKSRQRGGSAYAHLMRPVASRLTAEQMRDVALYYESLGSGREGRHGRTARAAPFADRPSRGD